MLAVFLGFMQHIDSLPRVRLCVAVYLACLDFLIRRTLILGSCIGTESLVSGPSCSTNQACSSGVPLGENSNCSSEKGIQKIHRNQHSSWTTVSEKDFS